LRAKIQIELDILSHSLLVAVWLIPQRDHKTSWGQIR
jgi:hypothetical protein